MQEKDNNGSWFIFWWLAVAMLVWSVVAPPWAHSAQKRTIVETAGWYAKDGDTTDPWTHKVTASGEVFDENAMTAASWQYPLGTYVAVTNTRNGKNIVVKINDRGPSKHLVARGRIIDLSKAAFQAIADLDEGVIPVTVWKVNIIVREGRN